MSFITWSRPPGLFIKSQPWSPAHTRGERNEAPPLEERNVNKLADIAENHHKDNKFLSSRNKTQTYEVRVFSRKEGVCGIRVPGALAPRWPSLLIKEKVPLRGVSRTPGLVGVSQILARAPGM